MWGGSRSDGTSMVLPQPTPHLDNNTIKTEKPKAPRYNIGANGWDNKSHYSDNFIVIKA